MIYYEEKTQEEVARYFGITKSAVSHAMERVYERMKKILYGILPRQTLHHDDGRRGRVFPP